MKGNFIDIFLKGFFSFALPFAYLLGDRPKIESGGVGKYFKQTGDYICKGIENYEQSFDPKK